jgi:large subunit ribosomal protein L30
MMKLKIKQIRSIIDRPERQKLTIKALGLGRPNWEKIHNDTPQIRGMINKVIHLVEVSEFEPTVEEQTQSVTKPVVKRTKKSVAGEKSIAKKTKKTVTKAKKESESK